MVYNCVQPPDVAIAWYSSFRRRRRLLFSFPLVLPWLSGWVPVDMQPFDTICFSLPPTPPPENNDQGTHAQCLPVVE